MGAKKSSKNASTLNLTVSQIKEQIAKNSFALSGFDSSHSYFATISKNIETTLKIWDTNQSCLLVEIKIPNDASSLSWGSITTSNPSATVSKKKRKSENQDKIFSAATTLKCIAIGLADGAIHLYSISTGECVVKLASAHTSKILDFAFLNNGIGYSSGADGLICEWDLVNAVCLSKFQAHSKFAGKIAISNDRKYLISSEYEIKLWNIESKALLKTFTGHASEILSLKFSADGLNCVSCAEQDRYISVWDLNVENGVTSNVAALVLDTPPTLLSISQKGHLLALTESGQAYFWSQVVPSKSITEEATVVSDKKSKKKSKKINNAVTPTNPDGSLLIKKIGAGDAIIPILSCDFSEQKRKLWIVRGSSVKPDFEIIDYLNPQGQIQEKTELSRTYGSILTDSSSMKRNVPKNDTEVTVLSTQDFQLPSMKTSEQTLEDRLTSITLELSESTATPSSSPSSPIIPKPSQNINRAPTANTLHTMLSQAIHSTDDNLLERCLVIRDSTIVYGTVKRLPAVQAVALLQQLLIRLQGKPSRAGTLVEWIRAILLAHSAYLIAVPDLVKNLSQLYQTLDARVSTTSKLLKLSGRLDLISSQISARRKAAQMNEDEEDDVFIYNEDQDDEIDELSDEEMAEYIGDVNDEDMELLEHPEFNEGAGNDEDSSEEEEDYSSVDEHDDSEEGEEESEDED